MVNIGGYLMPEFAPYGSAQISAVKSKMEGQAGSEPTRGSVYLHSGHLHASKEPSTITTILGSCVAVCMWDAVEGVGGATHYLLPNRVGGHYASVRFGNCAIEQLIGKLLALGGLHGNLQAKIFGGACIFAGFKSLDEQLGTRNVEVAVQTLETEGIPIITHDTGGGQGRKLIFNTDSGDAWVKLL